MTAPKPNPIAVALKYERQHAPRVVASGRGAVGEAIIAKAKEAGVPIQQNPALAEALATIEIDQEIPEALYKAVAQVLAFIMRTAGHLR
ncbi:EscU/YscU/HrcU family type III secretion system export apparatus switch protein [Rhizomicrobium electricum]|uniref:EscU/YscU/HrcU family type III secretion system export apparatus switch protein n=1 Tax=Rhizomicrobium electricum TaxID=480070 RepID=A0ABN1F7P0_9PROT|nr:EscU/YscU/HrcU family type III secretion system export apparatus switch protein [Rhizomicrobium electricum]NIJ46717.1 flagellar biosynthesis protein [Rhizomicrobium electricum]